jgi:hypothetical protein
MSRRTMNGWTHVPEIVETDLLTTRMALSIPQVFSELFRKEGVSLNLLNSKV